MKSQITLKKIMIALGFLSLLGLIGAGSIIYYWIQSINIETLTSKGLSKDVVLRESSLDAESYISKNLLETYFLFSEQDQSFQDWLLQNKTSFEKQGKRFFIKEDIKLPNLKMNTCDIIYCYQHRLKFEEIPGVIWRGLIGVEDYRFIKHQGVDLFSVARAIWVDVRSMSFAQGASTLTMQLVKNLFLTSDKKLIRKLKEMVYAIYIENSFSKDDILTSYFNEVWWGSFQGIRIKGLYGASLFYFSKKPQELNEYEATILISLLKGPNFYHPLRNIERLKNRVVAVYEKLKDRSLVLGDEDLVWKPKDWKSWSQSLKEKSDERYYYAMWRILKNDPGQITPIQELSFVQSVQRVRSRLKNIIKDEDVAVKALIANPFCQGNCSEPYSYYSKFERDKAKAISEEKLQVGSILKPIIYSIYIDQGLSLEDFVKTGPISLDLLSGKWSPGEASRIEESEIPLIDALRRSRNRPTIRLANMIGFDELEPELYEYLGDNLKKPLREYPAQLIGAIEFTLTDLFKIYTKFLKNECAKRGKSQTIIDALSDPNETTIRKILHPSLKQMRFFGKTGTTNNGLDSWFVSFDGKLLRLIWMGLEGNRKDKKLLLSGASGSFRIFQNSILDSGKRFNEFTCPDVL